MSSITDTGDATDYTEDDSFELVSELDEAWPDEDYVPSVARIAARVEWSGSYNRARDGFRTVRLDGLQLRQTGAALATARATNAALGRARTSTRYSATGWHAQLRALTGHARGSELADAAGLDPTARTLSAWLAQDRTPTRANQDAIAAAYSGLRQGSVAAAGARHRAAVHAVTDALSAAVRDRYGTEVRFFGVRDIDLT